ncbi:hypothetical protein N7522_004437, partial [Penicillium canescens]
VATSASALWLVTYYTGREPGKEIQGFETRCQTIGTGTEPVMVSTYSGNNITLSTDTNCNTPYEDTIPSEVTDRCVNAAIHSFIC